MQKGCVREMKGEEEWVYLDVASSNNLRALGRVFSDSEACRTPGLAPELTGERFGFYSCIFVSLPGMHGAKPLFE